MQEGRIIKNAYTRIGLNPDSPAHTGKTLWRGAVEFVDSVDEQGECRSSTDAKHAAKRSGNLHRGWEIYTPSAGPKGPSGIYVEVAANEPYVLGRTSALALDDLEL